MDKRELLKMVLDMSSNVYSHGCSVTPVLDKKGVVKCLTITLEETGQIVCEINLF